jgi:hypothetical protein
VAPDLVIGRIEVSGGSAKLTAVFADATLSRATTALQFALDLDQTVVTGSQPSDYNGLGIEMIVNMGSSADGLTKVLEYNPATGLYTEVGSAPLTFGTNTMEATVPLSVLKNDDGKMNFKVVTSAALTVRSWTGILDYMTDPGLPPGTVQ